MSTFYLPDHAGSGVFQTTSLGPHANWSFCDLTPCRDTVVDERSEHAGFVLAFNLKGEQQWCNRDTGRKHRLLKNHFGIYEGGTFAASNVYEEGQRSVQLGLHIRNEYYPMLFETIRQTGAIGTFNHLPKNAGIDIPPVAGRVIQDMIQCNYTNEIREYYLEAKLAELIAVLAGELTDRSQPHVQEVRLSDSDRAGLEEVKRILDTRYADAPTIPELVRPAMMNENKLKRAFKQQYGRSIHAYVIQKRMEKARELLESGQVGVSEAAHLVGYVNSSYFISRFRQTYGYNPSKLKG
ncbi:AraC family transcriptional regulator [Paenibacillus sp. FSL K6-1318]|uniref:helix-turn-helix transcriptional regulator n=1 Tax=Paenibacillus sp. FSL K6-1318 TaxID=2975291 RepID=UPI0030ECCE3A